MRQRKPKTALGVIRRAINNMKANPQQYNQGSFCGTAFCRAGHLAFAAGAPLSTIHNRRNWAWVNNRAHDLMNPKENPRMNITLRRLFESDPDSLNNHNVSVGVRGLETFRNKYRNRLSKTKV